MRSIAATGLLALLLGCGGGSDAPKKDAPPSETVSQKGRGDGGITDNQLDLRQKSADRAEDSEEPKRDAPRSSDETVHSIDLAALLGHYEKDEVAADKEYRTKLVEMRGVVETIEGSVVVLSAPGAKLRARCAFPGGFGDGVPMNPGLEIRIRGRVKGRQGDVFLEECRVRQ